MLEKSFSDAPWIDLMGGQDYLPLKKPLRIHKTDNGFYVKEFELNLPGNYTLDQIKQGIKDKYFELFSKNDFTSSDNDKILWEKVVESGIVDYDAIWDKLNKGRSTQFKLRENKDKKRSIRILHPVKYMYREIPKQYKNYFENLSLGIYQASIKYSISKKDGRMRIKSIDNVSPLNI
jgi:hypothetical protein